MNTKYYVNSFEVKGLWGERAYKLSFDPEVNIIIGPNASGKTTLLNLLHLIFSGDFVGLSEIEFTKATVKLQAFEEDTSRTVTIESNNGEFKCKIGNKRYKVDLSDFSSMWKVWSRLPTVAGSDWTTAAVPTIFGDSFAASGALRELVPTVWLPVSRRLPIPEDEYSVSAEAERNIRLDSVDERLRELMRDLSKYRLSLEARLSERYKVFQQEAMGIVLYSDRYDQIDAIRLDADSIFSEQDKELLIQAFREVDLLNKENQRRIERHFKQTALAIERFGGEGRSLDDFLVIHLIPRTASILKAARNLDEHRQQIFAPLRTYEETLSDFFEGKSLRVLENGELEITASSSLTKDKRRLGHEQLSSGEKQILILLTQALLKQHEPVVLLTDEPELSLHVLWQEKLLKSLLKLSERTQIIVATHSPDIIGPFPDNVIDLGRMN